MKRDMCSSTRQPSPFASWEVVRRLAVHLPLDDCRRVRFLRIPRRTTKPWLPNSIIDLLRRVAGLRSKLSQLTQTTTVSLPSSAVLVQFAGFAVNPASDGLTDDS